MDLKEQYDKLLRYCYAKTGDRYLAEDIVQESFLRFWKSRSYKDTGRELAYLYTIARNLCTDEFRRPGHEDIDSCIDKALQYQPADDAVQKLEIERALDLLPSDMRELIVLRYVNDIPVSDIAKILGVSRFAVYRRVRDGLTALRTIMEGDDEL